MLEVEYTIYNYTLINMISYVLQKANIDNTRYRLKLYTR